MEINGQSFENISFSKALDILKNNTHLSLTVKTNIFGECSSQTNMVIIIQQLGLGLVIKHLLLQQSSKSSTAESWMRKRTAAPIFPKFRRKKATAYPSLSFQETWSLPQTTRPLAKWRPTLCQEDGTGSGRCWRKLASAYFHLNLSSKTCSHQIGIFDMDTYSNISKVKRGDQRRITSC